MVPVRSFGFACAIVLFLSYALAAFADGFSQSPNFLVLGPDQETADEILNLLEILNREMGKTIIMVTHDPKAAEHARQVIHMDKGTLLAEAA